MNLSEQIINGLEELGADSMMLTMLVMHSKDMPDANRQQLLDLAAQMATKIDAVRTLARTIPIP